VRIVVACTLAFFASAAIAENIVLDDPSIQYAYSFNKVGSLHFCDFATIIGKAPMVIKVTAAFITDDTKPQDKNANVMYIVEAFVVRAGNNSQFESKPVKVVAGRISSDSFKTDLHASKNINDGLGASYTIPSVDSLAQFLSVMTITGAYLLSVEFEDHSIVNVDVKPTEKIFETSQKWNKCSAAIMQHQPPK
jgi:hypothetical protein